MTYNYSNRIFKSNTTVAELNLQFNEDIVSVKDKLTRKSADKKSL